MIDQSMKCKINNFPTCKPEQYFRNMNEISDAHKLKILFIQIKSFGDALQIRNQLLKPNVLLLPLTRLYCLTIRKFLLKRILDLSKKKFSKVNKLE